ncbi:unnamed protein product [Darwinula stevensoni]|uniref:PHD-type domain-containing protein n=1 Tax=Darwinula stevensoni TaxID=69355 RepID=A0A7R8X769_9CRUS|nr:unnamed protein product [Darwinula stevensoni]CAG0880189.1 unnamed protein product [Darwinula stevensoni]
MMRHGAQNPDSPGQAKKRRKTSNVNNSSQRNNSPSVPDLIPPPPMSGYGDTIVASNPFDDMPMQPGPMRNMSPMGGPGMGPGPMGPGGPPMGMGPGMPPGNPGMMAGGPGMMQGGPPMMGPGNPGMIPGGPGMGPNGPMGPGMGPKPMPVSSGKIYPPDQPMVFNPQNPNAPPIYPCGICHKEVHDNDQAILCESGCNFWFHRVCTGLTEPAFHLLTAEVYAEWVCDKCLHSKNIPLVKFKP